MIGEREIDVLLLPEMSRAERAGQAKKMNNSYCRALRRPGAAAARRRHRAKQHRGYIVIGREKSLYYAFRLISCQPRPGMLPGRLGEIQAVTQASWLHLAQPVVQNQGFGVHTCMYW
jgi:hypothetical protein